MRQELGTGPKVGRMFLVDKLRLSLIAHVSVAIAVAVFSIPSLAFGMLDLVTHLPLGYNNCLLEVC